MICVDTTFLVDLWRNKASGVHPALELLDRHQGESFAVPAHAAGEFLEGGAHVSQDRFDESLKFLQLFKVGGVGLETARHYAQIVSSLRRRSLLVGASKVDMWIAAWAVEHGATLVSRNTRHFEQVPNLVLVSY